MVDATSRPKFSELHATLEEWLKEPYKYVIVPDDKERNISVVRHSHDGSPHQLTLL